MAKKFLKFLAFAAMVSAAVAVGIALYKKYTEKDSWDDDFDDFDDDFEDEDLEMENIKSREYVPITLEAPKKENTDTSAPENNVSEADTQESDGATGLEE
ncbi:hypothetical protein [Anaerosacchariphilus polymeriproducens]|uniref:DUF4366 domain-containing protein n=1 Tax=Anaerosacchariphilus polymeriproducens TaxID=1812858 RepID=A0A371ASB7_9FIRM|nr:hypothetical protein [Anaerosacchariphilus polymeriproducens]RDU22468.1 hypothetical protein DWV06_14355 [Anaerosacchariphilus polymeriproducens]